MIPLMYKKYQQTEFAYQKCNQTWYSGTSQMFDQFPQLFQINEFEVVLTESESLDCDPFICLKQIPSV